MSVSNSTPVQRWAMVFACVLCGSSLGAAQSAAAAGRRAAPVQALTISSELRHATGHSAAQLSTRPVCGAARPGRIHCVAQLLTVTATGRAAHPLHAPQVLRAPDASAATAAPQPYTAAFLQWAYDSTWLSANRGTGDTVAIVDAYDDPNAVSDLATFRSQNGLTSCPVGACLNQYNQSGQLIDQSGAPGTAPPLDSSTQDSYGWEVEESLDLDAVSSLCPSCHIDLVEAQSPSLANLEAAVKAAHGLGANPISMSFGSDVKPGSQPEDGKWAFAGVASIAAAGDGSYPGPAVGYPAAYPDVTAVGGTSLTSNPTNARGFDESAWALQTCSDGSTCGTESGCDTSQPIPSYQSGITTGCSGRAYNDISADADPDTGLNVYDTVGGSVACGGWCVVGGTSLATPLTAAIEALTGVAGSTPAWAYNGASLLNDVVSGSDGTCPSGWYLICNAAAGWDGPTGNGSISGALTTGGPQAGGNTTTAANATDATLSGGLYPNGESTSYSWQYWVAGQSPSTATSTATATTSGSALRSISGPACSLTPSTTYDYYMVAANGSGSATGYQGSFTTAATESAPSLASAAAISGNPLAGQTLSGQAAWDDQSCYAAPSYQWQESSSSSGPWATVATAQTYTLSNADVGKYLQFVATESNSGGSSSSTSPVVGPVVGPPVSTTATTPASTTQSGTTTTTTVRFYRCARRCILIATHGATTYKPRKPDYGRYLKVVTTVVNTTAGVSTTHVSTRWIGPVTAATAGYISVGLGARIAASATVRGSTHRALARVRVAGRHGTRITLVVTRTTRAPTQAWAYVVRRGAVVSATRIRSLARPLSLRLALKRGQTLRLVAVRS